MKKHIFLFLFSLGLFCANAQEKSKYVIKDKEPVFWESFTLSNTRLLHGSPFYHTMELDKKYLLGMNVNRMLNGYRRRVGSPQLGEYPDSNQPAGTRPGEMCPIIFLA